jgi:hypothetical protein
VAGRSGERDVGERGEVEWKEMWGRAGAGRVLFGEGGTRPTAKQKGTGRQRARGGTRQGAEGGDLGDVVGRDAAGEYLVTAESQRSHGGVTVTARV